MKKAIIMAIFIVMFLAIFEAGCITDTGTEDKDWIWNLPNGKCTDVLITQEMIDCVDSDNPDTVFSSLSESSGLVVMQQQNGQWKSWVPDEPVNTLTQVLPGETYKICINLGEEDQVLKIEKC